MIRTNNKNNKNYNMMFSRAAVILCLVLAVFSSLALAENEAYEYGNIEKTFLNQDPDPAEPGSSVELRWTVQKTGNAEIEDLIFQLDIEYPFSFENGESAEKEAGDFIAFSDDKTYYTLYYKLRVDDDALEDDYEVTLKSKFEGREWSKEDYTIRVGEKERPEFVVGKITSSPTKLVGDIDEAELEVNLENIGDGDAENTKVQIDLPDGFNPSYSYSNRAVLGTVAGGSSEASTFFMDIDEDIEGGVYDAVLNVEYKEADDDDNMYRKIKLPLEIQVMDKPLFEVSEVTTTPESISRGDSVELRIGIKNVGGKEAESVSLRAFKESSQPFEFDEKSDFIGKLNPGEKGDAVLRLEVDKEAAKKDYMIDVEIRCVDGDQVIVQEKTIRLAVNGDGKKKGASPVIGLGITALIVLGGISLFFIVRNKK